MVDDLFKTAIGAAIRAMLTPAEFLPAGGRAAVSIEGTLDYDPIRDARLSESDLGVGGLGDWVYYTQYPLKGGDRLRIAEQVYVCDVPYYDGAGTYEVRLSLDDNQTDHTRL